MIANHHFTKHEAASRAARKDDCDDKTARLPYSSRPRAIGALFGSFGSRKGRELGGGGGVSPRVSPVELAWPSAHRAANRTRGRGPRWPHDCVGWLSAPRAARQRERRRAPSRGSCPVRDGTLCLGARGLSPSGVSRERAHRKWPFELHLTSLSLFPCHRLRRKTITRARRSAFLYRVLRSRSAACFGF